MEDFLVPRVTGEDPSVALRNMPSSPLVVGRPPAALDPGASQPEAPEPATLDQGRQGSLDQLGPDLRAAVNELFLTDAPERLHALHAATHSGDLAAVASHAHALKGSSGDVGALAVRAHADALERAARGGGLPDPAQLQALESAFDDVRRALNSACRRLEGSPKRP